MDPVIKHRDGHLAQKFSKKKPGAGPGSLGEREGRTPNMIEMWRAYLPAT